ncbi:MAG: Hpt domain-containing protein [Pseudomonadota bacterium]|nr:Hpt domain-containing protein [Pseudomonadota bacterium]
MDRTRYRSLFVAEAHRAIATARAELTRATPPADPRVLLRCFHTLKGMSATMQLGAIAAMAHALEDVCDELLRGSLASDGPTTELIVEAIGHLHRQIDEVAGGNEPDLAAEMEHRLRGHLTANARTGFRLLPEEEPTDSGWDPAGTEDAVAALAEMLSACQRLRDISGDNPTAEREIRRVEEAARRMYARLAELREVPFATVLPPLRRRLRALCKELGREARLDVQGEDLRVDPEVLGPLQAALVHLLHNAMAHGIERPEDRGAKGRIGNVTIVVERVGRRLRVRFADDGQGLDVARLRAVAREPNGDPVELALRPGLTTFEQPGPVAGRGHGLPAVLHLVARLGGRLELESSRAGTRLNIEVPLHAELVRLILVRAGGQTLALVANLAPPIADEPDAPTLLGLPVTGTAAVRVADGQHLRVDQVLGAVDTLVSTPPWPLDALPHLVGTTVAPEGHILLVVDPSSAPPPRGPP